MKKILLASFLLTMFMQTYGQSETMRDVFGMMPDSILPYMSRNNRLDLIDFSGSGMKAEITNAFDEHTKLVKLTSDYLMLELSEASCVEMKLLPLAVNQIDTAKNIVCVVSTFGKENIESRIEFYTTKWGAITEIPCPLNGIVERIIVKPDTMSVSTFDELKTLLNPVCIKAVLAPEDATLTIMAAPSKHVSLDDKGSLIDKILRKITVKWDGEMFK